jgi:hypothetical protein
VPTPTPTPPTPTPTPPPAVGGMTELHVDGADPSVRSADGSGPAVPLSAAILAAAMATLALAASAWYARSRWLR